MNGEVMTGNRRGHTTRMAFPDKANPNRPAASAGENRPETRGEARSFPERCEPRHSQRPLTDEQRELVTRYMPMARALARQLEGQLLRPGRAGSRGLRGPGRGRPDIRPRPGRELRGPCPAPHLRGAPRLPPLPVPRELEGRTRRVAGLPAAGVTDDLHGRVIGKEPDAPIGQEFEAPEAVASIIRVLPQSQADACRLLYFEGKSCTEAAEVLGCSKGYVSRLHSDALAQLRRDHREALAG